MTANLSLLHSRRTPKLSCHLNRMGVELDKPELQLGLQGSVSNTCAQAARTTNLCLCSGAAGACRSLKPLSPSLGMQQPRNSVHFCFGSGCSDYSEGCASATPAPSAVVGLAPQVCAEEVCCAPRRSQGVQVPAVCCFSEFTRLGRS